MTEINIMMNEILKIYLMCLFQCLACITKVTLNCKEISGLLRRGRKVQHLTTFIQHEYQQPNIHNDLCSSELPFKVEQGNTCVEQQEECVADKDTNILDKGCAVEDVDLLVRCQTSSIISKRVELESRG